MVVKLSDVCERESSNLKQSDIICGSGRYPVYGAAGHIGSVDFYHQEAPYIAVVKDGAGIGRTVMLPGKSSVIGTMQYLIPKDNVIPEYLCYVVQHMHLEKYFSGATIPHIYYKDYKNEEFNVATLEDQECIVKILDMINEIKGLINEELDRLNELIKARFVEMFGDPIQNPNRWRVASIGDIATDIKYGTSKPSVECGKYPYLRMNNITYDGKIDINDLKFIDIAEDEIEKYIVRKGDILFNRTNSIELVGKTALFDLIEDMVIAGYIIRVRIDNRLLPEVLSQYMNSNALKDILRGMAKGAVNQANINAQELKSIKVYIPDMELQKKFVMIKGQVDKSKVA